MSPIINVIVSAIGGMIGALAVLWLTVAKQENALESGRKYTPQIGTGSGEATPYTMLPLGHRAGITLRPGMTVREEGTDHPVYIIGQRGAVFVQDDGYNCALTGKGEMEKLKQLAAKGKVEILPNDPTVAIGVQPCTNVTDAARHPHDDGLGYNFPGPHIIGSETWDDAWDRFDRQCREAAITVAENSKAQAALDLWKRLFDGGYDPWEEASNGAFWCGLCNGGYPDHNNDCVYVGAAKLLGREPVLLDL